MSAARIVQARQKALFDSVEILALRAKLEQYEVKLLAAADAQAADRLNAS